MECMAEDCKNEFENKTGRRRFCSDACKMKWHRKHPKKNTATKLDIQVLLNEFKAAIQEMGGLNKQTASDLFLFGEARSDGKPLINGITPETKFEVSPVVVEKTFEQYKQLKFECDNDYDWSKLKAEIMASSLSTRQKDLLTKIN
jgi:hypothetical protein